MSSYWSITYLHPTNKPYLPPYLSTLTFLAPRTPENTLRIVRRSTPYTSSFLLVSYLQDHTISLQPPIYLTTPLIRVLQLSLSST